MTWAPTHPVHGLVTPETVATWLIRLGHDNPTIRGVIDLDDRKLHQLRVLEDQRERAMERLDDELERRWDDHEDFAASVLRGEAQTPAAANTRSAA